MPICEDLVVYEDRARRRSGGAERAEPRNAHAPAAIDRVFFSVVQTGFFRNPQSKG